MAKLKNSSNRRPWAFDLKYTDLNSREEKPLIFQDLHPSDKENNYFRGYGFSKSSKTRADTSNG
jgi:hypothetical protein